MAITLSEVERIIKQFEPDIRAMGVKEIYIFGSVARGDAKVSSDVDCFVVFEESAKATFLTLARLQLFLEQKLKTPVDLGTKKSLHKSLKDQILKEAVRVA
jgi:predicted nucleotidyltransferase